MNSVMFNNSLDCEKSQGMLSNEYEEVVRKLNDKIESLQKENSELRLTIKSLSYVLAKDLY